MPVTTVSTAMFYEENAKRMNQLQADITRTQQQIATGKSILTPSDDPIKAARALEVSQLASTNTQYTQNRQVARDSLNTAESIVSSISNILASIKTTIVQAGNPALDDAQRGSLALDLQQQANQLLDLANSRDGNGRYVFAGFASNNQPYYLANGTLSYAGDEGVLNIQVNAARQMPITISGRELFEDHLTGDGIFSVNAVNTNTGTGLVNNGVVIDSSALTNHQYAVNFTVGASTTYSVIDTTSNTTVSSGNPYESGSPITVDGMQFTVTGTPANGDQFNLAPSMRQNVFKTINTLVQALQQPSTNAAQHTILANALTNANVSITTTFDNVQASRSTIGAGLRELDTMDQIGEDLDASYQTTQTNLSGVDYVKAISDLTFQVTLLDAARASFTKISGVSLFNYLT